MCYEDCDFCYKNSLQSHPMSIYLSEKNTTPPRNVFLGSDKEKFLFVCKNGHEFDMYPCAVNRGYWCPMCKNKTEAKFYDVFINLYPSLIMQYKPDWCKNPENGKQFFYDFCIPELSIIIEIDGEQHYRQVKNWHSPEHNKIRDSYKNDCALKNGFTLIRMCQIEIWRDKIDQVTSLKNSLYKREEPELHLITNNKDMLKLYDLE